MEATLVMNKSQYTKKGKVTHRVQNTYIHDPRRKKIESLQEQEQEQEQSGDLSVYDHHHPDK
jgi:hypothetical protein